MRISEDQEDLISIGMNPVAQSLEVSVVEIHRRGKGVTLAAYTAMKRTQRDPRAPGNFHLCGTGKWDCVQSLIKQSGASSKGSGYLDLIWRCMLNVSKERPAGLVFWLDDARGLRPRDMEQLTALIGYTSLNLGINTRLIFMVAKSAVWNHVAQRREEKFLHSQAIMQRAAKYSWCAPGSKNPKGLIELVDLVDGAGQTLFDWKSAGLEMPEQLRAKTA